MAGKTQDERSLICTQWNGNKKRGNIEVLVSTAYWFQSSQLMQPKKNNEAIPPKKITKSKKIK